MSVLRVALPAAWSAKGIALRKRWQALAVRERRLVLLMLAAPILLLLWWVLLQPALRTIREAPARVQSLEVQLQEMRVLATEARELRAQTGLSIEQSAHALKAATEHLGSTARLQLQGERAIVTLNGVSSGALRDWLLEARSAARARPIEAQLTRGAQGFSGSVVLSLGGAP